MDVPKKIKEFDVLVPWGHLAIKAWGNEEDEAVLILHGGMDNAGTFDRLIPHLPNMFYYICIDLPGHGKSSHFPPHLPIYTINFILVCKLLVQFFKREKYIFMGHSYGGQISFLFAQLYPTYVKKIVMLDTVHMYPVSVKEFKYYLVDSFNNIIKIMEKVANGTPPTYTYAEAVNKIMKGREGTPLSIQAATALAHRALQRTNDGRYRFTVDQRLKNVFNPLQDFRYILESLKTDPITCPVLIILAKQSVIKNRMELLVKSFKTRKNITMKYVDGSHDVHNENPAAVAPIINKFLLTQKGKL